MAVYQTLDGRDFFIRLNVRLDHFKGPCDRLNKMLPSLKGANAQDKTDLYTDTKAHGHYSLAHFEVSIFPK